MCMLFLFQLIFDLFQLTIFIYLCIILFIYFILIVLVH